ncbi:TIGR01777 family oxidoreductase [Corynebacterium confusum]|uniref:TIGR01777 family oxidoreductase n=1 Tax=Corynebacterium confusum TaxID=71254 RepID=UPI0025B51EB1|nr:TIGR01777 family oxidoreductase [Corynebacterium confusum]WJY89821.1 Epimerase family protein [Corynebacterium confusum]
MTFQAQHVIPADREQVWEWHTRLGAVSRLTPPFLPMAPQEQARSLADGTTVFSLPAGLKWVARHDLSRYRRGVSFSDVCVSAPLKRLASWRHDHHFADHADGTLITDTVDTRIPSSALEASFAYRQHKLIGDFEFINQLRDQGINILTPEARPLTVAITGSRGSVGRALSAELTTLGHRVIQLVRSEAKDGQRTWNPNSPSRNLLDDVDVLVHLAGEPIFGRFNDKHKQEIRDSRVGPTRKLAQLVAASPDTETFVCASAIGYYGNDRGDEVLTEDSASGDGFLAEVVRDWEAATAEAREAGKRVVNIRTGIALTGASGLLPLLRALFSTGLGGSFGDGDFWFSWVAFDDLCDIYTRAIFDTALSGPVNAASTAPVLNREMTQILAEQLKRPAAIPIPALGPALLLGKEGAQELALADQRVAPAKLQRRGHVMRFDTIQDTFAHELGNQRLWQPADAN